MQYQIREKAWSLADQYHILGHDGEPVYRVEGKVFSWGDDLKFTDLKGRELARISQKLLSLKPRYELYRDGEVFAEIRRTSAWFKSTFLLDVPGPNDYEIEGSFWQQEYVFRRGGRQVAQVSKVRWSWTDRYGVEIVEGEDDIAILATVVVIDLVCHDDQQAAV